MQNTHNPLADRYNFGKIILYTLPNMLMMVFTSLYTIVDGMFISRLAGEIALSATNMYYPVMSIQWGIGVMLGTGGSAIIARKLGQKSDQEAREDFTMLSLVTFIAGLLFAALSLTFLEPILKALGTSESQMADARAYAVGTLIFSPMMFLYMVFQIYFVTAGKPKLGLWLSVAGGVVNIILDWLFMGPLNMGIAGAAIATGIGWSVLSIFALVYFTVNRHGTLYFVRFNFRKKVLLKSCSNGSSEMVTNVAIGVTTFLFNILFMRFWKEAGIATITILSYYQFVFNSLFLGFSMGIAPVISYKYGAGDEKQLKKVTRDSLLFVTLASIGVWLLSHATIDMTLLFFTDPGSEVYSIAMEGFDIYSIQFIFTGISIMASAIFTALSNGLISGFISFGRTFLFLVGSMLTLPEIFGKLGVWMACPIAEFLGFVAASIFLLSNRKKYGY